MYWYVSRAKVEALAQARRKPIALKGFGLKLKSPVFEVSADMALDDRVNRDLRWVREHFDDDPEVPAFDALPAAPGPIFSFDGAAARLVADDVYLLALSRGETALVLAGSRWHVLGESRETGSLGGSLDPVGAVLRSFVSRDLDDVSLSSLSYAWQGVMRQAVPGAVLPRVGGLALFGGSFPVDRRQSRRADPAVTRIVVGSPVYVEQR
jgi:hypothetical protein